MDTSMFEYKYEFYQEQLKGILKDISDVYRIICEQNMIIDNDENLIRDKIGEFFENQSYKAKTTTVCEYYYDSEVRLTKTRGRVDMRFLSPNSYSIQDAFFAIECKRIDGRSFLNKEYVKKGIRRFTTGKYPSALGCNAMLGFMVAPINLNETLYKINQLLLPEECIQMSSNTIDGVSKLESQHTYQRNFTLYHLWIDFSQQIGHVKS